MSGERCSICTVCYAGRTDLCERLAQMPQDGRRACRVGQSTGELHGDHTGLHKLKPERGAVWGRVYPLSGSISWRAAVLLPAAHLPIKPPAVARRQRRRRQAQSGMQFAKPFPPPSRKTLKLWRISSTASISGGRTACRPCQAPCRNCALTSRMVGQVMGVEMDRARRAVDQRQLDLAMPSGHP